jgi:NAD(P)-dependent dehydrogenase (short-subunit alcohol dehydrogenase family)
MYGSHTMLDSLVREVGKRCDVSVCTGHGVLRPAARLSRVQVEAGAAPRAAPLAFRTGPPARGCHRRDRTREAGIVALSSGDPESDRRLESTEETMTATVVRQPEMLGQTVVVIGGSAGIGLETARRARSEGAEVVLTARDPERLERAAKEVGARNTARFDATDPTALKRFFDALPGPIDHVLVTGPGPRYGPPMLELSAEEVRLALTDHVVLSLAVARCAAEKMRPGGTLIFMGGTGGRRISRELGLVSAATAALPPFTAALALELAPVRVNLIAAGFVDTPLSATLLGDALDAWREELRTSLPIGRVVTAADVAALAVHIMTNTALTGATYDIDGGQQFVQ